jgi:glucose/arabinose dehydrogenase/mono/diheme cytochrome c family protein
LGILFFVCSLKTNYLDKIKDMKTFNSSLFWLVIAVLSLAIKPAFAETIPPDGRQLYLQTCAACHQPNGQGVPGSHPPLSKTSWVNGSKEQLIKIVLKGFQQKIQVNGVYYDEVMPGMPHLKDKEIAAILTYVRGDFGNQSSAINSKEVAKVRAGQSLNEPKDFSGLKPDTDYSKVKETNRVESQVGGTYSAGKPQLERLQVPTGFRVSVFAQGLQNPRSLALGPDGTVVVGTRRNEEEFIYAIQDKNGDWLADTVIKVKKGLKWNPMGVAFNGPDLYVGEIDRILRFKNFEANLDDLPEPELIFNYPPEKKHGEKYIRFGPDNKLYVPVGAPCNICLETEPIFSSITRINPDGTGFEVFAHGVRNSRGFDWHPQTKELWFSDNGRDLMGDDIPPCEINRAPKAGMHFGYPYCHAQGISDPEFGSKRPCSDFEPAAFNLVAHAAPVSLKFYTGKMFPDQYRQSMLVTEHGSWNRTQKQGYRIMALKLDVNKVVSYEPFLYGFLDETQNDAWGRPADILQMPDGSVLVTDDYAGAIYRIAYDGKQ